MTRLFIAEKPDMGKKIAAALNGPHKPNKGYIETGEGIVTWCVGHILESFNPDDYNPDWKKWDFSILPMIPPQWSLKVDSKKKDQFNVIKTLMKSCSEVINAGDPGREGQLIVDEVLYYLNNKKPVKRILLDALDKPSILNALQNLKDNKEFYNLFQAAECRGYADWIIGMNGTRAYTIIAQKNKYQGVLSVGRVQSPTLAIVVNRDEEIDNFVPHDYYIINAIFSSQGKDFITTWKPNTTTKPDVLDSAKRLIDLNTANSILAKIKDKPGQVIDYAETMGKSSQPLPFNLSKLQIFANAKWGMSAQEVLDTCQSLYQNHELQSYPRTDCQYFKESHHNDAPVITQNISAAFPHLATAVTGATLSIKSPAWNDKKLSDHYALMPTQKQADLSKLNPNELKIYQAVCERYLAQFYPECEFKSTTITIECEQEHFKASGRVIIKSGWKAVYEEAEEETSNSSDEESEQKLPVLQKGSNVDYISSKKSDKKTTPPSRFTEGTLIKAMTNVDTLVSDPVHKAKLKDKKGIGQESTRTSIINTLFKREFLVKKGKQIISTPTARTLIHNLPKRIIDPALTAIWEDALDKIADGKLSATEFKDKQHIWVQQIVNDAKNVTLNITNTSTTNSKTVGKSSSSNNYASKSKTSAPKAPAKLTTTQCPTCKAGMLIERKTKDGKTFLGCNKFPNCKHVEWPKK